MIRCKILSHLQDGNIPYRPERCPKWLYEKVMKLCWDQDRTCRPTATEILTIITENRPVGENYEISRIPEETNGSFDEFTLAEPSDIPEDLYESLNLNTRQEHATDSNEESSEVTSIKKRDDPKKEEQCGASRYVNIPDKQTKGNERCFSTVGLACGGTKNSQCQHNQELYKDDNKSLLKLRRKPQRDLIDVPNYELFSEKGNNVDTEVTYPPTVPNYENDTAIFSGIDVRRPFPFKSKHQTDGQVTPCSYVHKENPRLQSDG